MAAKDKELNAISSIIDLLKPLSVVARSRVLEYVLKRLDMDAVRAASDGLPESAPSVQRTAPTLSDIRTLTAEKQPRSVNEMVAVVAYYVSELAPEGEKSPTINVDMVRRYFKMARFPLPRAPQSALPNAVAAGYLANVSRGEYRLNPVGYNLVVHGLPRSSSPGPNDGSRKSVRRGR
jgi:hypothetical protein